MRDTEIASCYSDCRHEFFSHALGESRSKQQSTGLGGGEGGGGGCGGGYDNEETIAYRMIGGYGVAGGDKPSRPAAGGKKWELDRSSGEAANGAFSYEKRSH